MPKSVVRCKHCNRPIICDDPHAYGEWIHKETKSVPVTYFACSMYARTKSKRDSHPPFAEPKELTDDTIKS
jgi:hypothetical protein